ncbi:MULTISPECIES: alpha/beta fold hydrolase [Hymenobacter]|uniref:Alpha/beta fold hydrolase n=1 Tax=Hymenobacter jejuensis TaxID=2502781 RepID=A0A5B8A304_9BACT|nr:MULTISPECIES: alpha/beta fold hydrolase [Hymenobacter]MBC6989725.1 alpha/beta fold hydrolase [Hymenobacter sp. BT491]QDA61781.1 alpha/beta fold hydrolase [Hymenobacter jejuensis]
MQEHYRPFYSHHLGHDLEMLVFGQMGYPIVVFPTSMGRYYEAKDFLLVDSVRWFLDNNKIKLYCIDSVDRHTWYAKHLHPSVRIDNHTRYDQMLSEELFPMLQRECHVDKIGVAGCSFGGYQALNYAFRHPEQVAHLFTMGAAFDIKQFLDGHYDDNVYYHNPPDFMSNANSDLFQHMNIVLGTAEHDFCKGSNYQMSEILTRKGIQHWLDVRPHGTHDWPVWREMFPHYLSLLP